ncbi:uncharacterized protein [Parasteatoda tepidariorum]|nr:uncharacterized protein LOC107449144 [Parasteatoda tepidariorum]
MKYYIILAVTVAVIQAATNVPSSNFRNHYPTQYQGDVSGARRESLRNRDFQELYGGQRDGRILSDLADRDSYRRGYQQNFPEVSQRYGYNSQGSRYNSPQTSYQGSRYNSPQGYQGSRFSGPQSYQGSRFDNPQAYQGSRYSSPQVIFTSPLAGTRSFNAPLHSAGNQLNENRFY